MKNKLRPGARQGDRIYVRMDDRNGHREHWTIYGVEFYRAYAEMRGSLDPSVYVKPSRVDRAVPGVRKAPDRLRRRALRTGA